MHRPRGSSSGTLRLLISAGLLHAPWLNACRTTKRQPVYRQESLLGGLVPHEATEQCAT